MTTSPYDLHAHTTCSDGALTPSALVELASEMGVTHLAVTDHDTVAGVADAKASALKHDIQLISGVEVSSTWSNMDIHIVGLAVNENDERLIARLATQGERRVARAKSMCHKLEKLLNQPIYEFLIERTGGKPPGRPDIAQLLIDLGHCRTMNEVFRKYLAQGKSAYVKTDWPDIATAIRWIKEADGGVPVLAHPSRYKLTRTKLSRLIACFKNAGGEALEVTTSGQDPTKTKQLANFAAEFGLLASTGSDFHSPEMPWVKLGKHPALPKVCTPVWSRFSKGETV